MAGKISEMTAAVSALDADQVELLQSGANKRATVAMLRATTLPLAGGTMTGAIVLSGAPTVDLHAATKLYVDGLIAGKQPLDATLTALAALGAGPGFLQVTGQDTFSIAALTEAQINTALGYTAANAAALNASNLTSGTLPDARFPATLPAASGANLTTLNASNLSSGTVATARLGSGTADSTTYLRGDQTWQTIPSGSIDGSGTANALPYWTDSNTLGDSPIYRCAAARIGFGGTTDSEPGIRWSSTVLDFVTAAAGAFIGINVLYLQLANTTKIKTISDGLATITDSVDALGSLRVQTLQVGNSAAATTLGTVTDKIEIFDAAGASLGFIAVYDAIS